MSPTPWVESPSSSTEWNGVCPARIGPAGSTMLRMVGHLSWPRFIGCLFLASPWLSDARVESCTNISQDISIWAVFSIIFCHWEVFKNTCCDVAFCSMWCEISLKSLSRHHFAYISPESLGKYPFNQVKWMQGMLLNSLFRVSVLCVLLKCITCVSYTLEPLKPF